MKHPSVAITQSEWDEFDRAAQLIGLIPTHTQRRMLEAFSRQILHTSQSFNLLSSNDLSRIPTRHILDSLLPTTLNLVPPTIRAFDLGPGAGFPGIPLAIIRPDITITLIESNQKKAEFLRRLIKTLNLPNASIINARIETLQPTQYQTYDLGLVRAVSNLAQVWQWSSPLLKSNGKMICYKGPQYISDIEHLKQFALQLEPYALNVFQIPRDVLPVTTTLVEITKTPTPITNDPQSIPILP